MGRVCVVVLQRRDLGHWVGGSILYKSFTSQHCYSEAVQLRHKLTISPALLNFSLFPSVQL